MLALDENESLIGGHLDGKCVQFGLGFDSDNFQCVLGCDTCACDYELALDAHQMWRLWPSQDMRQRKGESL
jgi:hypothetical protein